jgi:nitroreductase
LINFKSNGFVSILKLKKKTKVGTKIMQNQVLEVIKKRSSAREYSTENITDEELNAILNAGLQAPTATNKREIHFTVVKGDNPILDELDEEKRKLRGQDKQLHNFYYEAPVLIFISSEDDFKWSKVDSGIAVQNMSLAAESLGLGSLIIGCVYDALNGERKEYFSKAINLPEGYSFQIAFAVGHKTDAKFPHEYDFDNQVTVL